MCSAVIHARISKDDSGDHLGVDRHEKACRKLARHRKIAVTELLVDNDASAMRRKPRPQFERLVEMLKDGTITTVIVYHVDRLYRRAADLERLVEIVELSGAHSPIRLASGPGQRAVTCLPEWLPT